jgi:MinD-like ATPase involved in chromosome partitioning or flagellar assembly
MERVEQKPEKLERFYSMLSKQSFDFIIIDTPPGLFEEAVARYFRDVAIITTPDSVSSNGSARMAQYCDRHKLEHRLIINRAGYSKYDLEREEVEKIYGDVAFLMIPEDKIIAESIMKHKPAYMIDREADFCVAITELAREYSLKVKESQEGEAGSIQEERETQPGFFEKMARWLFKQ